MNPTPARRRRAFVSAVAGGMSALGLLSLVPTGAAGAAINPPEALVVEAPSPTTVSVRWTPPSGGDEPTYYIVSIDGPATDPDGAGPLVDPDRVEIFREATARTASITNALPTTAYVVQVCPNNEPAEACATATVTTPRAPDGPPVATGPFRPFFTVDAFIRQNYGDWLDRQPTFDELTFWRTRLSNGMTRERFLETLRTHVTVDPIEGQVIRLYTAYFLRRPDFAGFEHWRAERRSDRRSIRNVSEYFAASAEFSQRYGSLDDAEFVALVYRNVLGRSPDAAGFAFWTRQLGTGSLSRGKLMLGFSESGEFKRMTARLVISVEIYADMLERVPTLAEYDAITRLEVPPRIQDTIYDTVTSSAEYRGRIITGL